MNGIACNNIKVLNDNLLACRAGENNGNIGTGVVVVTKSNGYSSPERVCKMFEYYGKLEKKQEEKKNLKCVYTSPKIVNNLESK